MSVTLIMAVVITLVKIWWEDLNAYVMKIIYYWKMEKHVVRTLFHMKIEFVIYAFCDPSFPSLSCLVCGLMVIFLSALLSSAKFQVFFEGVGNCTIWKVRF